MKRILKITAITFVVIILLLIIIPFLFRGKIENIVRQQINNSVNADVNFDRITLSLIRTFPNLNAGIRDLYIANINEFSGDTLLRVGSIDVTVDIVSALRKNVIIRKIIIDKPEVKAHVLTDGSVNWDIMKPGEPEEEDTTAAGYDMNVKLKLFQVNNGDVAYIDDSSNIQASLENIGFTMKGDMAKNLAGLNLVALIGDVDVMMGGVKYLNGASMRADINVDADMEKSVYTLKDNSVSINDLTLNFEGAVSMPNEVDINTDLTYGLEEADFKSILSLVPAIYMNDYSDVEASGSIELTGAVTGTYNEVSMPDISMKLLVRDGMFKYPDLPASADNINIDAAVLYDGVQADNSTVDISRFHVELGSNPVDMTLSIKTPVSDMYVNGGLNMDIDLGTLSNVIPLDSVTLSGRIKSTIDLMGYLSSIEKGEYEKFKAGGVIEINNLAYESSDLPKDFTITEASLFLTPMYLDVKSFSSVLGKSDFQVTGKLSNFLPYIFKDGTVSGDFVFTSGTLDLNEFMTEESETVAEEDTVALTLVEVPRNVDLKLVSRIDHVYYDKLQIDNLIGTIYVKDQRLILEGARMNLLEGTVQIAGEYSTKDIANPLVDFGITASEIDIPSAFEAFSILRAFAPIAQKAIGKVNLEMDYNSYLNANMMPVLSSIVGKGSFNSKTIGLKSTNMFNAIGNALNTNTFENMTWNDLGISFEIRNGRLIVDPFEAKMGKATFVIGGDQGLDQTMNYVIGINLPSSELGAAASSAINNLIQRASGSGITVNPAENLNFNVTVGGTFTKPSINLNLRENTSGALNAVKEQAVQAVQEQVDKKKEEAMAAAKAEADKIIAEAEQQAQVIRDNALKAADIVRNEGEANAQRLVNQAKDPISKRIAEEGGKKIMQEAENSAQAIINEADRKAEALIQTARDQAARLLE